MSNWDRVYKMPFASIYPQYVRKAEAKGRRRGEVEDVLKQAEENEVLGKMKVSALLEALPGVGKVRAQQTMERLEIAPSRRLRGLGDRQRKALLVEFSGE